MKRTVGKIRYIVSIALCALCVFACGCASAGEKNLAKDTVNAYFDFLRQGDFERANALCLLDDSTLVTSDIERSELNLYLFENIEYSITAVNTDKDKGLYADALITQHSLYEAYVLAAEEYSAYIQGAEKEGKSFSEEALAQKFDSLLLKQVKDNDTTVSKKVRVYISSDGKIKMNAELRNILFGGELDAINDMKNIK